MGLTVLDAGVVIGFLDANDTHHQSAHAELRNARDRNDRIVLPASAFAEASVGPTRRGAAAVGLVRQFVHRLPIDIEPLSEDIAIAAAALRAHHKSLKLPDALVIATAGHLAADHLLTTDRNWPSRAKLKLAATITEL